MAQYLDNAGLQELVKKTKEYARKSAKDAVNTSAAAASKTITGWDTTTNAATYSDIAITSAQVTDLKGAMDLKANLLSPDFTGVPTAPTAATGTNNTQIATTEFVQTAIGTVAEAMLYKGTVDGTTVLPTTGYKAGWTYKVAVEDTYAGKKCEVGDMIIANKDHASGTASNADWDVIQTNIDGAVSGPASATDGAFVLFDGNTGKLIKNSDVNPSSFKRIKTSAAFDGNVLKTIQKIEQNANGDISVTFEDIQSATTSQKGVVELVDSIGATVSEENNKAASEKAVRDAINALDVEEVTVGADKTLVSIGEADGKIQTEAVAIKIAESQVTDLEDDLAKIATSAATLNTKIDDVSGAVATSAALLDAKITNTIDGLDFGPYAIPPSGTIYSISETDGKIDVTSGAIAITSDQVTDLGTVLGNYKTVQTAVRDPSADGTGITFIDSASQDTNGVITLHKKTVQSASDSLPGLMSAADFTKLNGIAAGATSAYVSDAGVLYINGTSAMGPISNSEIDGLFA